MLGEAQSKPIVGTVSGRDKFFSQPQDTQPWAETLDNGNFLTNSPASPQEIKLHSFTDLLSHKVGFVEAILPRAHNSHFSP